MARIALTANLVADLLFGYSEMPVQVHGASFSDVLGAVEFDIAGPDVPDADEVRGEFSVRTNRRGEKFHTLKFKPVA